MELDVRRLRVFREVAFRGTVAAAAESLGFTPSAVSQQLSALERESGTALFERAGRRLRLTDAGRLLVERTGPVLVALEEAKAALEAAKACVGGSVRVASFGTVASALVLPVAAALAVEHPSLQLNLFVQEFDEAVRELRLGGLDVVIAHEYDHDRHPAEPDLVRVDLFAEEMFVVAPSGRFREPVTLAELKNEVWTAGPAGSDCGRAVREACRAVGFEPDIRYHTVETGVALAAAARGNAVSLQPSLGVRDVPPGVDVLTVADVRVQRLVFALHRPGRPLRPNVALLLDRLLAADVVTGG